jgi:hypothetical protein
MSRADRGGDRPFDPAPPRLIDGGDGVAAGLRALDAHSRPEGQDETAAWRRLATSSRTPGARRWFWIGSLATAAVAVVILVGRRPSAPSSSGVAATQIVALPEPPSAGQPGDEVDDEHPVAPHLRRDLGPHIRPHLGQDLGTTVGPSVAQDLEPPAPRVTLSPRPTSIAPGRAALADEATVEVAEGSTARASADEAWVRVLLDEGEVGLHVAKRVPGGPGFEVVAAGYHFRVLGTRFRVARNSHDGPPVELWVEEGRVAVSHDGHALGVVVAGGHWDTNDAHAEPRETATGTERSRPARHASASVRVVAAVQAPAVAAERPAPPTTCATLASDAETARDAITCYLAVARRGDRAAETALYEIARLRRDVLGDSAGALAVLQDSRTRFPTGMLREEVDLSIVELLANLNRHNEAIEEIGRLLADGHGVERAAELRVMRGNIYREVLEDFGLAERDYAAAEEARTPTVGDATFFRGVCLQALGRSAEARATFERYLAAGATRFADEARRRLQRLGR